MIILYLYFHVLMIFLISNKKFFPLELVCLFQDFPNSSSKVDLNLRGLCFQVHGNEPCSKCLGQTLDSLFFLNIYDLFSGA